MPELYRSVMQRYAPTPPVSKMFQIFMAMINDCLRLARANEDCSFQKVKELCTPTMKEYPVDDAYRFSAMFEASNLLKKYRTDSQKRRVSRPFCRNPYLAVSVGVYLQGSSLHIPEAPLVPLTRHSVSVLTKPGVSVVSVTFTPSNCSVIYRRWVHQLVPEGMVGIDVNVDNITTFDTTGVASTYDMEALTAIHETYRRVKSRFRRNDVRVKGELFRKYADIEWHRRSAVIHEVTSRIVKQALAKRQVIVVEELKGLRNEYTRRSRSSSYYLSKMNSWPFAEILRCIRYKAEWVGLQVLVVSPEWTSEKCSECRGPMETPPVEVDSVVCLSCGLVIDRDLNGAKNILKRGHRSWPYGFAREAVKGASSPERGSDLRSRCESSAGPPTEGSEHNRSALGGGKTPPSGE